MSKIDELKADIERLPSEQFAELFRWLSEKEWESWDRVRKVGINHRALVAEDGGD